MEYTFILSRDARIDTVVSQLQLIDGIGCRVDGTNLCVQISDADSSVLEEQIFGAVAAGTYSEAMLRPDDNSANTIDYLLFIRSIY